MALVLVFLWLAWQAAGNGRGVRLGEEGVEDPARRVRAGFGQESRDLAGVVGSPWQQAPSWPSPTPSLDGPTSPSFQLLLEPLHLPFPLLEASRFLHGLCPHFLQVTTSKRPIPQLTTQLPDRTATVPPRGRGTHTRPSPPGPEFSSPPALVVSCVFVY